MSMTSNTMLNTIGESGDLCLGLESRGKAFSFLWMIIMLAVGFWRRAWQPISQYSCLENSISRGTWWAIVHGAARSQAQLKQLGMHTAYGFVISGIYYVEICYLLCPL